MRQLAMITDATPVSSHMTALSNALAESKHALTNLLDPCGMSYKYTNSSKATFYLWSYGGDLAPLTNKAIWIGNPAP